MTDSNLKPGAALTYEQAMALPDGAVVSALWNNEEHRNYYTVGGGNDIDGSPRKFEGSTLEKKDYWRADRWHSVRLESLPEPSKYRPILCDRCGTTYKNNERHACVAREPAKPERQASEIEKRAAVALLSERADFLQMSVTNLEGAPVSNSVLYTWARFYTEAYDYAKSIGALSE